ncbi:hypothetical protein F5Y04DRAFT_33591 [Hypomontagnella monticulosa]|nr:hypothetical protein F5Y04DRAFT_33591 [Hypomontagnella monticulosa]
MKPIRSCLPLWNPAGPMIDDKEQIPKIEDYRLGYPRFTALLSTHKPYFICRRFDKIRSRLLLLKQDRLSMLEERLERVDQQEKSPLFLGKSRYDKNADRISLLSEIESCLADYDQFAERTSRMLSFDPAQRRDVESLQNWLGGTGCLAREEAAYLRQQGLVCLAPTGDNATMQLEAWVENRLIQLCSGFLKNRFRNASNDPNVHIYLGPLVPQVARAILLLVITLLLLMPVIICNIIETTSSRIAIVIASTVSYLIVLSTLTKSRTMELVLAGATYATVLIVFVSGTTTT